MAFNDTIIQLPAYSTYTNINKVSNSEYSVTLSSPVTINQLDTITVKQAYIDTRTVSSANIIIDADLDLELEYYFYMMLPPDMGCDAEPNIGDNAIKQLIYANNFNSLNPSNLTPAYIYNSSGHPSNDVGQGYQSLAFEVPLILMEPPFFGNPKTLLTKVWKYTLKAGSYAYDEIALILTKAMSSCPNPCDIPNMFASTSGNAFLNSATKVINNSSAIISSSQYYTYDETSQSHIQTYGVLTEFVNDTNLNRTYYGFETDFLTNPFTMVTGIASTVVSTLETTTQSVAYNTRTIGASEISLIYNDGASKFEWEYLHTPCQAPASRISPTGAPPSSPPITGPPIEVVCICATFNNRDQGSCTLNVCKQTKDSGIIFKRMEPASFWGDILGFDIPNITLNDDQIFNGGINMAKFRSVTTEGFLGQNNMFDFSSPLFAQSSDNPSICDTYPYSTLAQPPDGNVGVGAGTATYQSIYQMLQSIQGTIVTPQQYINDIPANFRPLSYYVFEFQSIATIPLQAINGPISSRDSTGHSLISIDGYQSDLTNQSDKFQVKAIVSNYYQTQGAFTSQPFQDSMVYCHIGESYNFNNLRVRILDPFTMTNLRGIGPNSCVYLQIRKSVSVVEQKQFEG